MRQDQHNPSFFTRWSILILAVALFVNIGPAPAQRYIPDGVDDLRQALKISIRDEMNKDEIEYRDKSIGKRVKAMRSIGELSRALALQEWRDEDREEAVARIDRKYREEVVKRLETGVRDMLQSSNTTSRLAAVSLLSEMGIHVRDVGDRSRRSFAERLGPDLAGLLKDGDPAVRGAAARALGMVNADPKLSADALAALLKNPDLQLRQAAGDGLTNMVKVVAMLARGRRTTGVEISRAEAVQAAQAAVGAAGQGVRDSHVEVRRRCLEAIHAAAAALSGDDMIIPPRSAQDFPPADRKLSADERAEIEAYRKNIEQERTELMPLIRALSEQGSAIADSLDDPNLAVRLLATRTLEDMAQARLRLRRKESSVPRAQMAQLPSEELRDRVARANPRKLGMVEGRRALSSGSQAPAKDVVTLPPDDQLFVFAGQPPMGNVDKDLLGEALAKALSGLATRLTDVDVRVRLAACDALEAMGEDAGNGKEVIPALIQAFDDQDRFVRWAAVRALGRMRPAQAKAAVPSLARMLEDPDLDVARSAAHTLEDLGKDAEAAVPALAGAVGRGDAQLRIGAMRALANVGPRAQEAIPALGAVLSHPEVRVRRAAAEALSRFGSAVKIVTTELRQALNDTDEEVRKAASEALLNVKDL